MVDWCCEQTSDDQESRKGDKKELKIALGYVKKMQSFVNKEVKKCKAEYYSDLINKNKGNSSELWKTLNDHVKEI